MEIEPSQVDAKNQSVGIRVGENLGICVSVNLKSLAENFRLSTDGNPQVKFAQIVDSSGVKSIYLFVRYSA